MDNLQTSDRRIDKKRTHFGNVRSGIFLLYTLSLYAICCINNEMTCASQQSVSVPTDTSLALRGNLTVNNGIDVSNKVYLSSQNPITFSGMSSPALAPLNSATNQSVNAQMQNIPQMAYQAPMYGQPMNYTNYSNNQPPGYGNSFPPSYFQGQTTPQGFNQPNFNPQALASQPVNLPMNSVNPYGYPQNNGNYGSNSYMAMPPQYGTPPNLMQRNNMNYNQELPYRSTYNNYNNGNSYNNNSDNQRNNVNQTAQKNKRPQPNSRALEILTAQKPQEEKPKVASTSWFQKLATKAKEPKVPRW